MFICHDDYYYGRATSSEVGIITFNGCNLEIADYYDETLLCKKGKTTLPPLDDYFIIRPYCRYYYPGPTGKWKGCTMLLTSPLIGIIVKT